MCVEAPGGGGIQGTVSAGLQTVSRAAWTIQVWAPPIHDWSSALLLLAPSAIMYALCVVHQMAVPANLAFHAFMLAAILGNGWSLFRDRQKASGAVRYAVFAFCAMFGIGVGAYLACRAASRPGEYLGVDKAGLRQTFEDYGVRRLPPMLLFAAYFSVFNPWLEEVFWRQMMRWRLRVLALRRAKLAAGDVARSADAARRADLLSAVAYTSYHLVIMGMLMPPWFNFGVAFPFLTLMGLFLNSIADDPRFGILVCIALHSGLDAAAAFWTLDIRFGWLDPFFP